MTHKNIVRYDLFFEHLFDSFLSDAWFLIDLIKFGFYAFISFKLASVKIDDKPHIFS